MSGLEISLKGPFCSKRSLNNTEFQLSTRQGSSSNWQTSKRVNRGDALCTRPGQKGLRMSHPLRCLYVCHVRSFSETCSLLHSLYLSVRFDFWSFLPCIYIFKWHNMKCAPWFSPSNRGRVCNLSDKAKLFQKLDWPAALCYSLPLSLASLCAFINMKCAKM